MRTAIKAHISGFYFNMGFVSKTDLSRRSTTFPLHFSFFYVHNFALGGAELRWHEVAWGSPHVHANMNIWASCGQEFMCGYLNAHVCVHLTDTPNLNFRMPASVPIFSWWVRVEVVLVGGGRKGFSRFACCLLC